MKNQFIFLSIVFLSSCSYLGLAPQLNVEVNNSKIELQIAEETSLHPFAIWQGLTTDKTTEIKVLAKKKSNLTFKIFKEDKEITTLKSEKIEAGETEYHIINFNISDLKINTNYVFQVIEDMKIVDQRNFKTVDLNSKTAKIGVVSCLHDKFRNAQFKMWNEYLNNEPTYTFMIGDNVYADTPSLINGNILKSKYANESMLWERYVETFNLLSYYRTARLVPTLAIWDDHDYGFNNGNRTHPQKKQALKVFESFYGFKPVAKVTEKLFGAGYVFNAFDQRFVFTDGRFFRTEPNLSNKNSESHWGEEQTSKILQILNTSKPTWLIKGDQFFGSYSGFESFEADHPKDFTKLLSELKKSKSKVFFVSGDRHLNELMRISPDDIGYETFELTSSAVHAAIFPGAWKKNLNPRQIAGASGIHNYSIVELKATSPWALKVTSFGPKMKLLYQQELNFGDKSETIIK